MVVVVVVVVVRVDGCVSVGVLVVQMSIFSSSTGLR
jgi:hypothetical protein